METFAIEAIGGLLAVLLTIIGWLVGRSISQIDKLAVDLQEVKSDLQAGNQLREFQDRRIVALEKEKRGLYNAFNEMDRLIYRKWGESVKLKEEE